MQHRFDRSRALLAVLLLAPAPVLAQSDAPERVPRPEPELVDTGSSSTAVPPRVTPSGVLGDAIEPAALVSGGVKRSSLEAAKEPELSFTEVPGGVVFGLVATSPEDWSGARIERAANGALFLVDAAGESTALPAASDSLLAGALAFADRGASGEWLVDIDAEGTVQLAPELVDTDAGRVAVRADLVPQFYMPLAVGAKSVIVDRAVSFRRAGPGGAIRFETDLEVRFYRPDLRPGGEHGAERVATVVLDGRLDAQGNLKLDAPEGRHVALVASRLPEAAKLAGWIGFFRWAVENELEGLAPLRETLRPRAHAERTPRRIADKDRAAWVKGAGAPPPADVPDWMRKHREKVLGKGDE